jgi:putative serine protease PepD
MPLNEIKFETAQREVAGALVFTYGGELVGAINATLESSPDAIQQAKQQLLAPTARGGVSAVPNQFFGPGTLTVGYTVGPEVFRRVVEGFRSPSHRALHPALGVLCRDSPFGGAEVTQVNRDSAAEKAGLKVGDVIVDIGGSIIRNQIDFAKVMLNQHVGAPVKVTVKRGQGRMILDATIGAGD